MLFILAGAVGLAILIRRRARGGNVPNLGIKILAESFLVQIHSNFKVLLGILPILLSYERLVVYKESCTSLRVSRVFLGEENVCMPDLVNRQCRDHLPKWRQSKKSSVLFSRLVDEVSIPVLLLDHSVLHVREIDVGTPFWQSVLEDFFDLLNQLFDSLLGV